MQINKNWIPFLIAIAIGLIAVIYYIASGRGSLDLNTRELIKSDQVSEVNTSDPKKIKVTCKNGESYEIVFRQEQQTYDDLIFNACGAEGTQESSS